MEKGVCTKRKFAKAFLGLVSQKGIENIKINELTTLTGLSREAFYYHFKDKYDLVAWIYGQQKMSIVTEHMGKEPWSVTVARVLELIRRYSSFYQKGFSDQAYNNLENAMTNFTNQLFETFILEKTRMERLTAEVEFAIKFNSYGAVAMTKWWVEQGMKIPEESFGKLIAGTMPEVIKIYFEPEP